MYRSLEQNRECRNISAQLASSLAKFDKMMQKQFSEVVFSRMFWNNCISVGKCKLPRPRPHTLDKNGIYNGPGI